MLIDTLMYSAENDGFVDDWDKLSPALTLGGTGIDNGSNYTLPAREDVLKRFRVSVASIQAGSGPTAEKMLELDTANLYFNVKGGSGSVVPIGGAPSSTSGTRANGLPMKFQKVHFFASQYPNAFRDGPALNATATSMSDDPAEYCCYMLCSSPVKVNRAPHPIDSTQDSPTEGSEQTKTVAEWIPEGYFSNRLTIGGAPLTKIEVITGVERLVSTPGKITFKKGFVYAAFPTDSTDQDMAFTEINYIDAQDCNAKTAYVLGDGGGAVGTTEAECISDIYSILDCICSEMSQLTGADGTNLIDCCGTTTTTTTLAPGCETLPEEITALVDTSCYNVTHGATTVCMNGANIKTSYPTWCTAEETVTVNSTFSDDPDCQLCDCDLNPPAAPSYGDWDRVKIWRDETDVYEWHYGSDMETNYLTYCPYSESIVYTMPTVDTTKWYCVHYLASDEVTDHYEVMLGLDFVALWEGGIPITALVYADVGTAYDTEEDANANPCP